MNMKYVIENVYYYSVEQEGKKRNNILFSPYVNKCCLIVNISSISASIQIN